MFETLSKTPRINAPNSSGFEYPTVSGTLTVVAPAVIAASNMAYRYSGTVLVASIGENSTSSQYFRARSTADTAMSIIVSRSRRIWCIRWMSEDDMKVWIRGLSAPSSARAAPSMSLSTARANEQMIGPLTSCEMRRTASKSPGELPANPASITSTFSRANWCAILNFSATVRPAPADCSPSRSVVSKIRTWSMSVALTVAVVMLRTVLAADVLCREFRRAGGHASLVTIVAGFLSRRLEPRHHGTQLFSNTLNRVF